MSPTSTSTSARTKQQLKQETRHTTLLLMILILSVSLSIHKLSFGRFSSQLDVVLDKRKDFFIVLVLYRHFLFNIGIWYRIVVGHRRLQYNQTIKQSYNHTIITNTIKVFLSDDRNQ
jgi:hypothetical protein